MSQAEAERLRQTPKYSGQISSQATGLYQINHVVSGGRRVAVSQISVCSQDFTLIWTTMLFEIMRNNKQALTNTRKVRRRKRQSQQAVSRISTTSLREHSPTTRFNEAGKWHFKLLVLVFKNVTERTVMMGNVYLPCEIDDACWRWPRERYICRWPCDFGTQELTRGKSHLS